MAHIENIVIGKLLVHPKELFALNEQDWEENEKEKTLFTEERFLPRILVEIGAYKSVNEIRKNRPDLILELNKPDYIYKLKISKKRFVWIGIGPKEEDYENYLY